MIFIGALVCIIGFAKEGLSLFPVYFAFRLFSVEVIAECSIIDLDGPCGQPTKFNSIEAHKIMKVIYVPEGIGLEFVKRDSGAAGGDATLARLVFVRGTWNVQIGGARK